MGAPAMKGVAVHKASDHHHKNIPAPLMDAEAAALWDTLRTWLGYELPYTHSELPILYDSETDTATECGMGPGGERDYLGITATRIPMRLDLVRVDRIRNELYVLDIKTGSRSNSSPAHENVQLATQAVGASRLFGFDRAFVGLVFPLKTKCHEPEWHELGSDALDVHAGRLHRVLKMIPNSTPNRGDWCWKCGIGPAKSFKSTCPAWQTDDAA